MSTEIALLILIGLSIIQPLTFKIASLRLDHNLGPVYLTTWTLLGLTLTYPVFGDLLDTLPDLIHAKPLIFALMLIKGPILWLSFRDGLRLTQHSLSAKIYIMPTSLGFVALANSFLGENLDLYQWVATLGLCVLGIGFALRGHLQDLDKAGKSRFAGLIGLIVILAAIDHIVLSHTNWYSFLWLSNISMILFCLLIDRTTLKHWPALLTNKIAILTGSVFAIQELFKFSIMVTIIPVSVAISAQAGVIPLTLVLSALIWKERTWHEQMLWGGASVVFLLLLML